MSNTGAPHAVKGGPTLSHEMTRAPTAPAEIEEFTDVLLRVLVVILRHQDARVLPPPNHIDSSEKHVAQGLIPFSRLSRA